MGSPFYYDVLYSHGPTDVVFHDCMWSGVCTCCNATDLSDLVEQPQPQLVHQRRESPPEIKVEETIHYQAQTTTTTTAAISRRLRQRCGVNIGGKGASETAMAGARSEQQQQQQEAQQQQQHSQRVTDRGRPRQVRVMVKASLASEKAEVRTGNGGNKSSSADNKKLRHREVEKNRHRQLQAMVKTLSEKIPGRVEKETQVQTMKRAARYCVYLRDILAQGQVKSMSREKLEKIYSRSCDNVEFIMSNELLLESLNS